MLTRVLPAIAVATITAGCTGEAPSPEKAASATGARETTSTPAPASFINKVWTVAESEQVARGDLRVFLSDGTLVMASSHGTPAFGTWSYKDGQLTITEEGLKYDVEILELTHETFRIRIRSPGAPIVIRFTPAESPPLSGNAGPAKAR